MSYDAWLFGLERGVAAHHAGLVPAFKETVEELFAGGMLDVVFATETLALGINMPARTVVLGNVSKYNGETHELLRPSEYTQLTGRAGRRGIDDEGFAVTLWSRFVRFDQQIYFQNFDIYLRFEDGPAKERRKTSIPGRNFTSFTWTVCCRFFASRAARCASYLYFP